MSAILLTNQTHNPNSTTAKLAHNIKLDHHQSKHIPQAKLSQQEPRGTLLRHNIKLNHH